jgi:hypothetical protein
MVERKALVSSLESFKILRELKLDMTETDLDDGTLNRLTGFFETMEFMESLNLKISKTPISSESFEYMLKRLEKLPNLCNLSLSARDVKGIIGKEDRIHRIIQELKIANKKIRV